MDEDATDNVLQLNKVASESGMRYASPAATGYASVLSERTSLARAFQTNLDLFV